jgi:hypothetical protein
MINSKLYSLPVLMSGNAFVGSLETGDRTFECRYKPVSADVSNGRFVLTGTLSLRGRDRRSRIESNVRATLSAIQGAVNGQVLPPAEYAARVNVSPEQGALPLTEFTDTRGFAGVIYLQLSALDNRRLGIALDLSKVQMNCRLAPTSDLERELHWLYSGIANALLGEKTDEPSAREYAQAITKRLSVGTPVS